MNEMLYTSIPWFDSALIIFMRGADLIYQICIKS